MTDIVIECPMCGTQDTIMVVIACSIPVELYDGEAGWNWSEAEAVGEESVYECWTCRSHWQPNEMTADDFVKEYKDD